MQAPDGNGPRKRPSPEAGQPTARRSATTRHTPASPTHRRQQASVTRQRQQRQHRAQTSQHAQHAQEQAYPGRGKAHQQEQAQGTAASEENGCGSKGYTQRIKRVLYILRHKEYTRLHVKIFIKS